ncbi:MAG TPA: FtsX-like permease family protein, partial [Bacteroidetes bacterium]|nr:FtsX-like permease family protein [Bacteroidota bacterium]
LEAMGQYSDQWGQFGVDHTFIMLDENSDENSLSEKLPQLIENNVNPGMASIITLFVTPFNDLYFHSNINNDFEPRGNLKQVYLFSIIAALIMLIACLNFMNLSTARSTHRVKEVGMRKVFGSNRSLLVKQFLSESVLTTLFSMLLGLLIFTLLYPQLNNFIGKKLAASYLYHPISLLLLLVLSILVGIIAGIYPAIFFSRFQPIHAFKAFTGKSKTIFRKIMVITQFTIAICLIIVTIFVFKQLSFVRNVDLGFDKEDKLVMQPPLDGEKLKVFKNELLQIPGVEMATICFAPPGSQSALVLNAITEDGEGGMMVNALSCDYDYIPIFNLKLAEGRNFSEDNASDANGGIIMNEAAIKQLGIKDPVGKELSYPLVPNSENNSKIIGVLKDFHFKSLREEISPVVLFLDNQYNSTLVLKYKQENLSEILKAVSQKWDEMIPETAIEYSFLDEDYDELYNSEEKMGKLFIFFSVLIVFIACLGIYGLAIFLGEQRTKEIGVRKVMGASITGIMQLLSKDFTKWVIVANIIAIPIGYYIMNKWLQNFAYRTALSLWVFAAAGVIALIIALLTIGVQTYKTANLNPAKTLKYE